MLEAKAVGTCSNGLFPFYYSYAMSCSKLWNDAVKAME